RGVIPIKCRKWRLTLEILLWPVMKQMSATEFFGSRSRRQTKVVNVSPVTCLKKREKVDGIMPCRRAPVPYFRRDVMEGTSTRQDSEAFIASQTSDGQSCQSCLIARRDPVLTRR